VLTGGAFGQDLPSGAPCTFLWALDVEAFGPRAAFAARMDALLDQVKDGERASGVDELVTPGERGARRHRELLERGVVALEPAGWQILLASCERLGVALPEAVA